MSTYTVSATFDSMFEVVDIEAPTDELATIDAVDIIMTKAYHQGTPTPQQRLWARGAITFRNSAGEILREMEAQS
jgi:hypothetical protein